MLTRCVLITFAAEELIPDLLFLSPGHSLMDFLGDRFARRGRTVGNTVRDANLCNNVAVAMVARKRRLLSETNITIGVGLLNIISKIVTD